LSGSFGSIHSERLSALQINAKLGEDLIQQSSERGAARFGVGSSLCDEHGSCVAILVSDEIRSTVAVAFLSAEDIKRGMLKSKAAGLLLGKISVVLPQCFRNRGLVEAELLADVFEARESLYTPETKFFRDRFL